MLVAKERISCQFFFELFILTSKYKRLKKAIDHVVKGFSVKNVEEKIACITGLIMLHSDQSIRI